LVYLPAIFIFNCTHVDNLQNLFLESVVDKSKKGV